MSVKGYFINFFCFLVLLIFIIPLSYNFAQTATLETTLSLKQIDNIMIPYQNGFALPSFEKQNREILDLKGNWKKQRF